MISCKYECLGEVIVVTNPFLLQCIGFDDCNVYLLAFNFVLIVTVYHIYLFLPQALKS